MCNAFEKSKNDDLDISSLLSDQDMKELLAPSPNFREVGGTGMPHLGDSKENRNEDQV